MKRIIVTLTLAAAALATRTHGAADAIDSGKRSDPRTPPGLSEMFERGSYLAETKGDLTGAIQLYETLIADRSMPRSAVARALYRLGLCQLNAGEKAKAIDAFKRIINEYADETAWANAALAQMPLVFEETFDQIERNYYEEVDRRELMEAAIRGMVGKLEISSGYLDARSYEEMKRSVAGRLVGIGAQLRFDAEAREIVITAPLPGSPAEIAGLRSEDRIVRIDETWVADLVQGEELSAAVNLIRGRDGDPVTLTVRSSDQDQARPVRIVRGPIRLESVRGDLRTADLTWDYLLDPNAGIGYVRILRFAEGTGKDVQAALEQLKRRGAAGLILDLRFNPGGLLSEAVAVADLFLSEGLILTSRGRQTGRQQWWAQRDGEDTELPLVVLVNAATASAAEIVAASLQDHQRALVIGARTYGQGLIRSLIPLEGGEAALKIPTSAWYRPNGNSLHRDQDATEDAAWGVSPSAGYTVDMIPEEVDAYNEYRRQRDAWRPGDPAPEEFADRALLMARSYLEELRER